MNGLAASTSVLTNLKRYLVSRGWAKIQHPNARIELFQTHPDQAGDYGSVTIPSSPNFRDASELINEALRLIATYENAALQQVVDRVSRWDRDILRTRFIRVLGHEDSLPLGIASEAVAGLKEFIGYAAYTQTDPRPFFDKAGAASTAFAKHCLFGHTFQGSFGLTIECPIQVTQVLPIDGVEPLVPIERQVFERVANGLLILHESVVRDSIDPMLTGYRTGFNANMCRTLAEIYEKADGRRMEFDFSWSPQLRSRCENVWKPMIFEGRAYDLARIAATELEKAETYPDSVLQGRIVILRSDMPPGLDAQAEFEHLVTMAWEREEGQPVKIRVPLSPQQYIEACDAHKEGRAVQIYGIPEKSGKFWTLTKVHDFSVLTK